VVTVKAQAFIVERREAVLTFPEESDYHGAEIRAKLDVDVRTFLELQAIGDDANAEELRDAFTLFGEAIVKEWNLQDEDNKPVPATGDGFMTLPPAFCTSVIGAWAEAASTAGKV